MLRQLKAICSIVLAIPPSTEQRQPRQLSLHVLYHSNGHLSRLLKKPKSPIEVLDYLLNPLYSQPPNSKEEVVYWDSEERLKGNEILLKTELDKKLDVKDNNSEIILEKPVTDRKDVDFTLKEIEKFIMPLTGINSSTTEAIDTHMIDSIEKNEQIKVPVDDLQIWEEDEGFLPLRFDLLPSPQESYSKLIKYATRPSRKKRYGIAQKRQLKEQTNR